MSHDPRLFEVCKAIGAVLKEVSELGDPPEVVAEAALAAALKFAVEITGPAAVVTALQKVIAALREADPGAKPIH